MIEPSTLSIFLIATVILVITPGPNILYIIARSIDQGRMAGLVSALGVEVGTLFHITAAALGVSALLATSALAFTLVKYLGAAYLIYLGLRKLLTPEQPLQNDQVKRAKLGRIFSQGVIVNVLNPKVALFFVAFLPQFVDPSNGSVLLQTLGLGFIIFVVAMVNDVAYALLAGMAGEWLKGNLRFWRAERYFAGSVYIGLGVATALSGSSKK